MSHIRMAKKPRGMVCKEKRRRLITGGEEPDCGTFVGRGL